jgi:protein-disulfide isomerase
MNATLAPYLVTPADGDDHSLGPADASVTVIEYADFECLHCARVHPTLKQLRDEIPDALRLVFRHFPLVADHPRAAGAAKAAVAAGRQGKFWPMHDRLLEYQAYLSPDAFRLHAEDLGLDVDRFTTDLVDPAVTARIERDLASGRAIGVRGTPTLFVNGVLYADTGDPGLLRRAILVAATEARAARATSGYLPGPSSTRPREELRAV